MNKILLQCDNLCKRYQEGSVQTDVLHNVSFSVGEGEMMAIVGSSGSGKSTLLHLLGGLDTPTSGDVIFNGQPMSKLSSAAKAELVLADEPTGNLDARNADSIFQLLGELNRLQGTAFLVVTHDLQLAKRMSRQLEMRDGRLTAELSLMGAE